MNEIIQGDSLDVLKDFSDGSVAVKTYWAWIYIGFKERSSGKYRGSIRKLRKLCQRFCDQVSYCVTIEPVEFIYCKGREKGARIGLINYPRFPEENFQTRIYARNLAVELKKAFKQQRVSILFPDGTVML